MTIARQQDAYLSHLLRQELEAVEVLGTDPRKVFDQHVEDFRSPDGKPEIGVLFPRKTGVQIYWE